MTAAPEKVRLLYKVAIGDDCWEWNGYRSRDGYGSVRRDSGDPTSAHRLAYELFVGPIPDGYHVDHLCNNRRCVRPEHLEAVTPRENALRSWARRRALYAVQEMSE